MGLEMHTSWVLYAVLFIVAKNKVPNIVRGGSTYHNTKKRPLHMGPEMHTFCDLYTSSWEMFNLTSIHDSCYRRCSTWCPSMAMHPSALWQQLCPYSICFLDVTLSVMEMDSLPNVSHFEHMYRTQKVCISGPMFIRLSFLVLVGTITSQNIWHFFNTLYIFLHIVIPSWPWSS